MGQMDLRVVVGLALGGIPAVLIAAFIVKSLDLVYVIMAHAAWKGRREHKAEAATAAVTAA